MSEYDCVGVTSEYLDSLKNKIEELEQKVKEKDSIISDLHELKSEKFKMLKKISELEQQKAELIQAIESALNKSTRGGWLHRIFENIIEKYSIKI